MGDVSLGIAVPSLNQAAYVGEALTAIQRLDIPFEVIIRDGGSTDGTLEAIEHTVAGDDRFVLEVVPGEGQASAINRSWERLLASHPLVTWINTDDLHLTGPYTRLVRHLANCDDDTVMLFGDFHRIDVAGNVIDTSRRPSRVYRRQLLHYHSNLVPGLGMAIRSSALECVGLLNESLDYAFDYDMWLRLSKIGALRKHDEVVASFRWHDAAKTAGKARSSRAEHDQIARDRRSRLAHVVLGPLFRLQARAFRMLGRWT